jgi:hypothetical protein
MRLPYFRYTVWVLEKIAAKVNQMKTIGTVILLALTLGVRAMADDTPAVEIQVGDQTDYVPLTFSGVNWVLAPGAYQSTDFTTASVNNDGQSIVVDSDPKVSYGFGVTNTGTTTQTFTFTFPTTPLTVNLPAGLYTVSGSLSGSVSDGADDGVVVSNLLQKSFVDSTDAGVDVGSSTPLTFSGGAFSAPFGPFNAVHNTTAFPAISNISVQTSFDLSPGDSISFSGNFTIVAAPEPSGVGLGAVAALALIGLGLRTRRPRLA